MKPLWFEGSAGMPLNEPVWLYERPTCSLSWTAAISASTPDEDVSVIAISIPAVVAVSIGAWKGPLRTATGLTLAAALPEPEAPEPEVPASGVGEPPSC